MSNLVSALKDASFDGYATVRDAGLTGMITLRGDLSDEKLAAAVKTATGAAVPAQGGISQGENGRAGWMSPDELLLIVDHAQAPAILTQIEADLSGQHFLAVNVSDARGVFEVSGARCREIIAKLSPADMDGFVEGRLRRSRIAQIPAAFFMSDADEITVICFRSVAQYAFDLLKDAALPGGEVFV